MKSLKGTAPFIGLIILLLLMANTASALQLAQPSSDIAVGSWVTSPLWSKVNTAGDDVNFIVAPSNTSCDMALSAITDPQDPGSGSGCTVIVRHGAVGNGQPERLNVLIREGATTLYSTGPFTADRNGPTTSTFSIDSGGWATAPTNWGALSVRLISANVAPVEQVEAYYVALQCPDPPAGSAPTLSSPTHANINATSADLGATIDSDNGSAITERGTVWGLAAAPAGNVLAEGGTALGGFSHNRTGLNAGTQIYYRGYAVNANGTGYSPDGSFYTEPSANPGGMTFSNVTATGMDMSWTAAANGDGTLAAMQASNLPFSNLPADGTLYAANLDFTAAPDLGGGEKIVYRNAADSVTGVTGLSENTTYFVGLFEYAGTTAGASGINYRQTSPGTNCKTTEPATQATNVTFPTVNPTTLDVSWTRGSGDNVIVIMKTGALPFTATPADGTTYTANAAFGSGTDISGGSGEYVIYSGTGTTVNVTGLTASTTYSIAAYEYANEDFACDTNNYKQGTPATGTQATGASVTQPTLDSLALDPDLTVVAATTAPLTANKISCGGGAINCVEEGFVWNTTGAPTTSDNTGYSNTGASLGTGSYSGTMTGLPSGTRLYTRGYAINDSGGGETGYSNEINFYTEPGAQPVNLTFTGVTNSSMTINWNDPGGATAAEGAIVVMKQGSAVTQSPTDGTEHAANSNFGTGADLGGAEYVVFRGTGNSVLVTNLTLNTTYFIAIFQYTGTGTGSSGINYIEGTPLAGSQTTTGGVPVAPTVSTPVLSWLTVSQETSAKATTATIGATIDNNGGDAITAHGTEWSTSTPVTAGSNQQNDGVGSTGAFTQNRTGLPAASRIYFRGFATNSAGTGYSGEGSFYTEPSSQASSPTINGPSIDYFSMTVNYTVPAGADGVLVVVRQTFPNAIAPYDGTVYTADAQIGQGDTVDPSCFFYCDWVIAQDTANGSVDVTGLKAGMDHYFAVYAYKGSGTGTAGINYVQAITATAMATTTTTTNVSHNEQYVGLTNDDCANCHGGHHTTDLLPRGLDQYNKCFGCHSAVGPASSKDNIALHLSDGSVDCGTCHSMHSFRTEELYSTDHSSVQGFNLSFVRSNMQKYINTTDFGKDALEPTVFQNRPADFAFSQIDTPWNAVCQTCHTTTNHHTQDNSADHGHKLGTDCITCHPHRDADQYDAFQLIGGGTCNGCHASTFSGTYLGTPYTRRVIWNAGGTQGDFILTSHHVTDGTTTQQITDADCEICHVEPSASHMDGKVDLKDLTAGSGSFTVIDFDTSEQAGDATNIQNQLCMGCHDPTPIPFSTETKPAPNVFTQFAPTQTFYHPVRGTINPANPGINANSLLAPWNASPNANLMTCFDCHAKNGHGSSNQRMTNTAMNLSAMDAGTPTVAEGAQVETFCTQCHNPVTYITPKTPGDTNSKFEYHGDNQSQHGAGGGNQYGCFGCHAGLFNDSGLGASNGAGRGNIHGNSFTWPAGFAAGFATDHFMLGGWISGWINNATTGTCRGGNCAHKNGSKTYTNALD